MSEPETQQPEIREADIEWAADAVEVSCHPSEYKRAARARARGAALVEKSLRNLRGWPAAAERTYALESVVELLDEVAAALKMEG